MGKCVVCKTKKTENKCYWKSDDGKRWLYRCVCVECHDNKIARDRAEYKIKYDQALKYLKENNYYVSVHNGNVNNREIFGIGNDIMGCVDIIRKRMEEQGYFEDWIDLDWVIYDGCEITVVTYLSYIIESEDKKDKYGEPEIEKNMEYWICLTNEDLNKKLNEI